MRCVAVPAVLLVASVVVGTSDGAPRPKTLASYCSPSGDVCFGALDRGGSVRLEITTAAKYFGRYTLCVRLPGGGAARALRCGSFPVFRGRGGTWTSSIRLARQFPDVGPGVFRATWKAGRRPLGPTLRFRT
jgi:hypothetical protein